MKTKLKFIFLVLGIFLFTQINAQDSFETGLDGWTNAAGDNFNWTRNSGTTGSGGTGPTSGATGNFYMYIEATNRNSGDVAWLDKSYSLVGRSNGQLDFSYHMLGDAGMGTLNIKVSGNNGASFITVFSRSGNQGSAWISGTADLSGFSNQNIIVRFEGIRGTGFRSDVAIDDISISSQELDTDNDGVVDSVDLDDDNDGILDVTEFYCDQPTYANSITGSGTFQDQLYFFNWSGIGGSLNNGDTQTFTVNDLTIVATFSNVNINGTGGSVNTADLKTWSQALVGDLYNSSGNEEALYGNASVESVSFTVVFSATKNGVPYPLDILAFDAESTSPSNSGNGAETISFETNGEDWVQFEEIGGGGVFTTSNKILDITNTFDGNPGNSIFKSSNANTINVTVNSPFTAQQAVGFGIHLRCDTDNDGKVNSLDTDSDGDGCFDAEEGSGNLNGTDIDAQGSLLGGVGTTGIPNSVDQTNGQLVGDSKNASVSACACPFPSGIDTDGDGVDNKCDLDDDNDGILDTDEGCEVISSTAFNLNPTLSVLGDANTPGKLVYEDAAGNQVILEAAGTSGTNNGSGAGPFDGTIISDINTGNISFEILGDDVNDQPKLKITALSSEGVPFQIESIGLGNIGNMDNSLAQDGIAVDVAGTWSNLSSGSNTLGSAQIITSPPSAVPSANVTQAELNNFSFVNMVAQGAVSEVIFNNGDNNIQFGYNATFTPTNPTSSFNLIVDDLELSPPGRNIIAELSTTTITVSGVVCRDTDSDLIADYLDGDSDGDGCSDADEAYYGAVSDADSDNNGFYGTGVPVVDSDGKVVGASYSTPNAFYLDASKNTCFDNDDDGIADFADLDDDNDGILDIDECGPFNFILDSSYTQPVETITVGYNIENYGLNGQYMDFNDDKLTNPANFGPNGRVRVNFNLVEITHPITEAKLLAEGVQIFQIGGNDADGGSGSEITSLNATEIEEVYRWSRSSVDHIVVGFQGLAHYWGNFDDNTGVANPMSPTPLGTPVYEGIFGNAQNFNQGGTYQGKFNVFDTSAACPIIEDANGSVIAFIDKTANDVFFADYDILSELGGMTQNSGITSNNDILFGNLYAFLAQYLLSNQIDMCGYLECGIDTDKDGIIDSQDSDSDGDGCSDADEAYLGMLMNADSDDNGTYGSGVPTVDSEGKVVGASYPTPNDVYRDASKNACLDNDNDGIPDFADLDNDNDGILDTVECGTTITNTIPFSSLFTGQQNVSGINVQANTTGTVNNFSGDSQIDAGAHINPGLSGAEHGSALTSASLTLTFDKPIKELSLSFSGHQDEEIITFSEPASSVENFLNSTYGVATAIESRATLENGGLQLKSNLTGIINSNTSESFGSDSRVYWVFDTPITSLTISHTGSDSPIVPSSGETTYNGTIIGQDFTIKPFIDSDSDGIQDCFDTDSDNDGCPDALEGAGNVLPTQLSTLTGGSSGGSSDNLGVTSDATGIPLVSGSAFTQTSTAAVLDVNDASACSADLSLTKTVDKPIQKVGQDVVFTITVKNDGPQAATNLNVKDILPAGLTYKQSISVIPTSTTYDATTGIWDISLLTLAPGDSITLKIGATINTANVIQTNTAEIFSVTEQDIDSTPNNNN